MIEIFDDIIPLSVRTAIYTFTANSNYRIVGWHDRSDLELRHKVNLHSNWSLENLQDSKIIPYVEKVLQQSSFKDYTLKDFDQCVINLVKPGDFYYIHTHVIGTISILYYVNLQWEQNWAGETLFYKENMKEIEFASPYIPGRFTLFDKEPHTIRPQSIIGPAFRFTLGIFLRKRQPKKKYEKEKINTRTL